MKTSSSVRLWGRTRDLAGFWRQGLLLLALAGPLVVLATLGPLRQSLRYHEFADGRSLLGVASVLYWQWFDDVRPAYRQIRSYGVTSEAALRPQIRNPKSEIRNKFEIRKRNDKNELLTCSQHVLKC